MTGQTSQFVVRAGPNAGKSYPLSKSEMVIGRDISCDIVINAVEVSRYHARVRVEGLTVILEDNGSTNGTFVNGQRLGAPQPIRPGDIIMLGEAVELALEMTQFDPDATMVAPSSGQVHLPAAPAAAAAPPASFQPAAPPRQPLPSYAGQVPASPVAAPAMPAPLPAKKSVPWLWAGIGCVVIFLCVVVVGAIAFDYLDLYCTPPFDSVFSFLYACP